MADGRRATLLTAFLSMALMGASGSMVGALLPAIVRDLRLSGVQAGALVSSSSVGYMVASLVAGVLGDRFGFRRVWLAAAGLGLAALAGIATAPTYVWVLPALAAMGLVGGSFDGTVNAVVAALYGDRSGGVLNTVHLFVGLGATVAPLLVSVGLRAGLAWRTHFALLAVLPLAIGVTVLVARFPTAQGQTAGEGVTGRRQALRHRAIVLGALVLFLYAGAESSLMSWSALFLERVRAVPLATASLGVSLFGGSIMLGRLVLGQVAERIGYRRLVVGGAFMGAFGVALLLLSPLPALGWAGIAVAGLGYSGIFATVLAEAIRRAPGAGGTVSGALCAAGGLGGIAMPATLGVIADASGLAAGMAVVLAVSVLMGVLYRRT